MKVIGYCRVSARGAKRRGNLEDQEVCLIEAVEKLGGVMVKVFKETASGKKFKHRPKLTIAAKLARKVGGVLLAESVDRFVRSPEYDSEDNFESQASLADLQKLRRSYQRGDPLYAARSRCGLEKGTWETHPEGATVQRQGRTTAQADCCPAFVAGG